MLVAQLCLTLSDPMDRRVPGSSVYGILQARILEWAADSFFRGPCPPRDGTRVSCIADILYPCATRAYSPPGLKQSFLLLISRILPT